VKKKVLILLSVFGLFLGLSLGLSSCSGTQSAGFWTQSGNALYPDGTNWNVGIGMTAPQWPLHVVGNVSGTDNGVVHITNQNQINAIGLYAESWTYGIKGKALNPDGSGVLGFSDGPGGSGAGIGGLHNSADGKAVFAHNFNPNGFAFYAQGGKNYFENNVGIGTMAPDVKLTIKGSGVIFKGYNQLDEVIFEIGEGLDYSETFLTSQDEITAGTVMVIDPVNKGSLTISSQAYDKKVAGIVAGANGLGSGVKLGTSANGNHAVALAGRTYCNVDTQYGDIELGDLLTTSPTPGHAMVVKDFSKAQGAVLGKAMEGLSGGGKGQILVLVTLQ